jgi:APA family basic amino acid/polyamine antiporter
MSALRRLTLTKSIDQLTLEAADSSRGLKRVLGPLNLTVLGIGAIIGAGIFASIGTAALGDASRPGAGPGVVLSFLLVGVGCAFCALCYAELTSMIPISGSAYTYAYATLGELLAWIIGWDLIIEYAIGNIAVAISWSNYFRDFMHGIGINIPWWMCVDLQTAMRPENAELVAAAPHLAGLPILVNLPALAIVALITVVLVVGIRESAVFNAVMVGIKIIVLGFFVAIGIRYFDISRMDSWVEFAPNGWRGIQAGAAIVFFAYIGFDAVSTAAEETKNPKRDMPIGILSSLLICTAIYVIVAAVFTGMFPLGELAGKEGEPLTVALSAVGEHGWATFVALGSVIAHTAVLLVFQLGQPRIFFSMARDGLLPSSFARVHPRFRTPHVTTIWTGVLVGVGACFLNITDMIDLTNIGTQFAFILVCAGVLALRIKDPNRPRAFRCPAVWLVAPLGIAFSIYFMAGLPFQTWIRFGIWLLIGVVIYAAYGYRRSRLGTAAMKGVAEGADTVRGA